MAEKKKYLSLDGLTGYTNQIKSVVSTLIGMINNKADATDLTAHTTDKENPHDVTAEQVGALPLAGGTMNDGAQIARDGDGNYFVYGRDGALVKTTSVDLASGFNPIMSAKTGDGSWDVGTYTDNILHFNYITDDNYNADENVQTANIYFGADGSITASNLHGHATSATDANTVSGYSPSYDATGNTVALRDPNGYLYASYLNQSSNAETPTDSSYIMYSNEDGFLRKSTLENVKDILEIDNKVDKVSGKGLSTNDYTTAEKEKLAGISAGANKTTVDSSLSSSSANPVQNKVINTALSNKVDTTTFDSHTGNTTAHITSTERNNWNAAKTHADSAHAPVDAEVNQNAFSNVIVGSTTIAADSKTGSLTVAAGTGISVSGDATNDKVTITNSGVRSISTGGTNGTISVNTNGTSTNVAVKGLGSAAYTASTAYDAAGTAQTKADAALTSAKSYTDQEIADLINGAPTTLDTLGEIATAMETNADVVEALETAIGNKVDKVSGKGLSTNDYTTAEKNKLAGIAANANNYSLPAATSSALGGVKSGTDITVDSSGNVSVNNNSHTHTVSNISDLTVTAAELNKLDGVTATTTELNYVDGVTSNIQTQLDAKVDKVSGKGLSTNDYTTTEKNKLSGIATGAEVNQNAFSNVKVGSTTVAADAKTDTLELVAGTNVTLTPDATNDKITIAATDTVYTHPTYTARTGKPTANATPAFGGTFTVSQITSDGTGHVTGATDRTITIPSATASTSANGLMTKDMVTKLNGIAANANNYSHPSSGVTAGTYKSVTVNAQGHVTAGSNPTTLSGYGITDAVPTSRTVNGKALSSNITLSASDVGAAASSHTHNYAGSSSAGGSATSAVKLDSSAGSATNPVYFSGGKPVKTTYTLAKSVPSDAVFTDTVEVFVQSEEPTSANAKIWIQI